MRFLQDVYKILRKITTIGRFLLIGRLLQDFYKILAKIMLSAGFLQDLYRLQ